MRILLGGLLLILFSGTKSESSPTFHQGEDPKTEGTHWVMVKPLSDEFEGKKLNRKKWTADPAYIWTHPETGQVSNRGWYGSKRSLFVPEQATLTNGALHIEAMMFDKPRRSIKDKQDKPATRKYGGAIVRAKQLVEPGCYMEAKIQASTTAMSCAFWLATRSAPCQFYPQKERLELDILECVGRMTGTMDDDWPRDDWAIKTHWDRIFHFNTWRHPTPECGFEGQWNDALGKYRGVQKGGKINLGQPNAQGFHVYGCYWHADGKQIDYFLDGKKVKTVVPDIPFLSPMELKLSSNFYDWIKETDRADMGFNDSKIDRSSKFQWVRIWRLETS